MPKDLRSFISEVAEKRPDQIKVISEEVDPRFGVTAVAAKLEKQGEFPALYFETVGDTEVPAIVNLTATYDRLALALGTDVRHMVQHYAERQSHPIPPQVVQDAPDLRQQAVQQPGEPDRLGGQIGPLQCRARTGGVSLVEDEVEHVQDHAEPLGALRPGW